MQYLTDTRGPGGMTYLAFSVGFARLADHWLSFDLQKPWWHLGEVPGFLDKAEVPIIPSPSVRHCLPVPRLKPIDCMDWRWAMPEPQSVGWIGLGMRARGWPGVCWMPWRICKAGGHDGRKSGCSGGCGWADRHLPAPTAPPWPGPQT